MKRRDKFDALRKARYYEAVGLQFMDVETRWYYTFHMLLKAFNTLPMLDDMSNNDSTLSVMAVSDTQWNLSQDVCSFLETFADVTKTQSGQGYVSLSMSINLHKILLKATDTFDEWQSGQLKKIRHKMREKLLTYSDTVSSTIARVAKILYPLL